MTGEVVIMGKVADAITEEVDQLNVRETSPGLAELAVTLARSVDSARAPTGRASVSKELRVVMAELRQLAPAAQKGDAVDAVGRKREQRRAKLRAAQEGS